MVFDLIRFSFIHLGISYLLARSSIFLSFRVAFMRAIAIWPYGQILFGSLLYCLPCLGFWVGLSMGSFFHLYPWSHTWLLEAGVTGVALGVIWDLITSSSTYEFERQLWDVVEKENSEDEKDDSPKEIKNVE